MGGSADIRDVLTKLLQRKADVRVTHRVFRHDFLQSNVLIARGTQNSTAGGIIVKEVLHLQHTKARFNTLINQSMHLSNILSIDSTSTDQSINQLHDQVIEPRLFINIIVNYETT